MKRTNDFVMFTLAGLVAIVMIAVLLQSPADRLLILGVCGFTLFTLAWIGMYFRLRRELPEHALVNATYLNLGIGQRRAGFYNMLRLIRLHFERHRIDRWSILLIAGLAMVAVSAIGYALQG